MLGEQMSIQAPANLSADNMDELLAAGINDWGGVSPVTPDHVNPEAHWPEVEKLAAVTARGGKVLAPRLPLYPAYFAEGRSPRQRNTLHEAIESDQDLLPTHTVAG